MFLMDPADTLLTLGELAVALVGFAGVVTVFQMRQHWNEHHAQRLWNMLRLAFALLFFSLLPLAWLAADRSPWVLCSALLGLMLTIQAIMSTRSFFKRGEGVNVYFATILVIGGWTSVVVLGLNTLGIAFERGFAGYFIGLFWLVMATTMFFTRLVYLGFVADRQDEK